MGRQAIVHSSHLQVRKGYMPVFAASGTGFSYLGLPEVSIVIPYEPMATLGDILKKMAESPKNIRFSEICRVCDSYFGAARQQGSSHRVYKTPWRGDPRVNVQNSKGKAKAYQVKQVLKAIERLSNESN